MATPTSPAAYPPVRVTKSVSVYPKCLHPERVLSLSNLDRQCPLLMYLVFFYKPTLQLRERDQNVSSLEHDHVFSSLKSGLEETLSIWYPAAGRLIMNDQLHQQGNKKQLDIWCNNKGAVLVQAVTRVKISELGDDLSQYNDFFENLVHKPVVFDGNFSDMPLVVAQVTRFGCGGYSVGIGTSHSLFDGPSTYDFLSAWASNSAITNRVSDHHHHHHQLLHSNNKPVHERGVMLLRHNRSAGAGTGAGNSLTSAPTGGDRAAAIDHLYQLIKNAMINTPNVPEMGLNSNYVLKTFHVSGAIIESLKRRCNSSCSSFELIAAHLWKARTKAFALKKETMVCLQFAVDTRNKMVPPLPKGFSGNAYVLASVAVTAGELEELRHEAIVEKIKEAKNSIDDEYVKAYITALDGPQGSLPPLKELTLVSDWTRMPFHKINFLNVEAAYASPLSSPIPQVAYFMRNPSDLRGIDVRIGLFPQTLTAFSLYFLGNLQ